MPRITIITALLLALLAFPAVALASEPVEPERAHSSECDFGEMARRVLDSTVQVFTADAQGLGFLGTAFYIGNGEFATAAHLVNDAVAIGLRNADFSYYLRAGAVVVGYYDTADGGVAILTTPEDPPLEPLQWAGRLDVGEVVGAAGYTVGSVGSITAGVVSANVVYRNPANSRLTYYARTDAAINPGSSGGPLFDSCGNVGGVVTARYVEDRNNRRIENVAEALTEPTLQQLLLNIRAGLGLSAPTTPVVTTTPDRYDLDQSGTMDLPEVQQAIDDYLFGDDLLTLEEVLEIVDLYLFGY